MYLRCIHSFLPPTPLLCGYYLNASFLMVFLPLLSFLSSFLSKSRVIKQAMLIPTSNHSATLPTPLVPKPHWQAFQFLTLPSSFLSQSLHTCSFLCLELSHSNHSVWRAPFRSQFTISCPSSYFLCTHLKQVPTTDQLFGKRTLDTYLRPITRINSNGLKI